jgi:hypothetical protein
MYFWGNVYMFAEMVFSTQIIFIVSNPNTLKVINNVTDENIFVWKYF